MPLNPVRAALPNGATLLAKHTSTTPAVAINLAIRAGSAADPPGQPGLTWLLSRVLDRGTAARSAADIAEELDSRGITLTILVTRHAFSLGCRCLAEDFEPVLALLGDATGARQQRARAEATEASGALDAFLSGVDRFMKGADPPAQAIDDFLRALRSYANRQRRFGS